MKSFAGAKRFIPQELVKEEVTASDYSFAKNISHLALLANRLCNLNTGKEKGLDEVTQETFSIPAHYSDNLSSMFKSFLAPKAVDKPVLAEIALDPLFREFITLQPYSKRQSRFDKGIYHI